MDQELKQKIEEQQKKIDAIYVSVERTRKYFFWTMIATLAFFILPLIIAAIALPALIGNYISTFNELGL